MNLGMYTVPVGTQSQVNGSLKCATKCAAGKMFHWIPWGLGKRQSTVKPTLNMGNKDLERRNHSDSATQLLSYSNRIPG